LRCCVQKTICRPDGVEDFFWIGFYKYGAPMVLGQELGGQSRVVVRTVSSAGLEARLYVRPEA
jgi:hypothetical protein